MSGIKRVIRSAGRTGLSFAVGSGCLLASCVQHQPEMRLDAPGFVVIGHRIAGALGSVSGDTLAEIAPALAPAPVRLSSQRIAAAENLGVGKCNRYFLARSRILVLFSAFCGTNRGSIHDSRAFAIFSLEGVLVLRFDAFGLEEVSAIVPLLRLAPLH